MKKTFLLIIVFLLFGILLTQTSYAFVRITDLVFDGKSVEPDKLNEVLDTIKKNKAKNKNIKNPLKLKPDKLFEVKARLQDPGNIQLEVDTSQSIVKSQKDIQAPISNKVFLDVITEAVKLWDDVEIADISFAPLKFASAQADSEDGKNVVTFRAIESPEGSPDIASAISIVTFARTNAVIFMNKLIMVKPGTILDADIVFDPKNNPCLALHSTIGNFKVGGNNSQGVYSHKILSSEGGIKWLEDGFDSLPLGIASHSSVIFNNKMWVIGGFRNDKITTSRKVFSSDDGIKWEEVGTDALLVGLGEHTSVVFNNKLWVIGGITSINSASRKVYSSDDGITWTEAGTDALPVALSNHTSVVFNNKLWVIGGTNPTSGASQKVYSSDDGITWVESGTNALPSTISDHSSVIFNNKMWIIGGSGNLRKVFSSTDGITWTESTFNDPILGITSALPININNHSSVVFNNKMWVIGGNSSTNTNGKSRKVYSSLDGSTWIEEGTDALPLFIDNHSSLVFNTKLLIIGGNESAPDVEGGVDPNATPEDLQNCKIILQAELTDTAVRTIGNILGLESSAIPSAATSRVANNMTRYSLTNDDTIGLANIYPRKEFITSSGILSGEVRLNTKPVKGAHVVAEDTVTGEPIASTITNLLGKFTIKAIPAGTYNVYAEPLDGPIRSAAIPRNFFGLNPDLDFSTGVFPTPIIISPNKTRKLLIKVKELSASAFNINYLTTALTEADVNNSGGSFILPIRIMPGETLMDVQFWGSNISLDFGTLSISGTGVTVSNVREDINISISPFMGDPNPDILPGIVADITCDSNTLPGPRNIIFTGELIDITHPSFGLRDQITGGLIVSE